MTTTYHAPKPKYSRLEWSKFIAARAIFPPVLLWDLAKFGANQWLGEAVGEAMLPATRLYFCFLPYPRINDDNVYEYNTDVLCCKNYRVVTHDRAVLSTFEIQHVAQKNRKPEDQKYIIILNSNGSIYETLIDFHKKIATDFQVNVVSFNYRGLASSVDFSEQKRAVFAKSSHDLVVDGIAQVQRLLDQGVLPENIMLNGYSLGAAIGSLVAQHFHQLGLPIYLFNDRSFSSHTNAAVGAIRLGPEHDADGEKILGRKENIYRKVLGGLAYPFIKFGLTLVKWEINAGSAFKSIPPEYREYTVVRSEKAIREECVDDSVVPHYASIHMALKSERRAQKAEVDNAITTLDNIIKKTAPSNQLKLVEAQQALVQERQHLKSNHKMKNPTRDACGHMTRMDVLQNRAGQNLYEFFQAFHERSGYKSGSQADLSDYDSSLEMGL